MSEFGFVMNELGGGKMGSKVKITPRIELKTVDEIRALAAREIRSFAGMTRILLDEALAARKAARKAEREAIAAGERAVMGSSPVSRVRCAQDRLEDRAHKIDTLAYEAEYLA